MNRCGNADKLVANFIDEIKSDVAVYHGTKLLWQVLTARNVKVL
ncbi:protein of unknown function (plasmid) [Caballeronia sp. S22]